MNRNTSKENIKNLSMRNQIILGIICAVVVITAVVALNGKKSTKTQMSITEAQQKCMLMEEADMVNTVGEEYSQAVIERAEKHCLALWDKAANPSSTEERFIEIVSSDWENRKNEMLQGSTLQELYDAAKN
jgi:predicted nucleic acid-binding protein